MSDLKLIMPLHKGKEIAHNLNTCRGLICKVYIEPNFKKAIMSLMNDTIFKLQEAVKLMEIKNANITSSN